LPDSIARFWVKRHPDEVSDKDSGRSDQVQMSTDPLKSEALGWIEGELRPPH